MKRTSLLLGGAQALALGIGLALPSYPSRDIEGEMNALPKLHGNGGKPGRFKKQKPKKRDRNKRHRRV